MSGNIKKGKNWTISLTIALLVAIAAAVIGCLADVKDTGTNRIFMQASAGSVLFDHGKHSGDAESCMQCHHTLYGATQATSCQECHDDEMKPEEFEHAELKEFHARDCSKCHDRVKEDAEALSCRECHPGIQPSETNTNSCQECHDDDYTPDMMGHDEYQEIEDHSCLGCHTPKSVSEAYHTNCSHCHLETAPEKFTTAGGELQCGSCHLR